MSDIIKVNHLEGDAIKKIYVFAGKIYLHTDDSWTLDDGSSIFTAHELKNIQSKSIEVELVEGYIHGDDTIDTIKNKIIKYTQLHISTKELYLFGIQNKTINPSILYNQLTQEDDYKLTRDSLCQFLLNIVPGNCERTG